MRIIINSDILYAGRLTELPHHLRQFAEECARTGAIVVLPRTTVLEFEKHQTDVMNKSIADVERAYDVLRRAGVKYEERDAAGLFNVPNLVELFQRCGAKVEMEDPSLDDFNDAHRRACLHLSPQPFDTKSDEMRDLVIWAIALRIAKRDGGAALLSRDQIHIHDRGAEEAQEAGLLRVASVEDMQEIMGVESPGGKLARSLLELIWDDLRTAGLPFLPAVDLKKVDNTIFTSGERVIEQAAFDFKANAENGAVIAAHIEISSKDEKIAEAVLNEITVNGEQWREGSLRLLPDKPAPRHQLPTKESMDALREVIGG